MGNVLKKAINEALKGIENLKLTYVSDSITVAKLVLIVNKLFDVTINLDSKFQIDTSKVISKFDSNTKIIFITNPNNPTGNIFDEKSIIKIIESFQGIVFIDEAYVDYSKKSFLKKACKLQTMVTKWVFWIGYLKFGLN